jgi:hypothetical protein
MKKLYWIAFFGALAGFCSAQSVPAFVPQSIRGKDGFFRVGKTTAGYWWLMTPEGQPFYHIGVCAANRAGTAGGRRAQPGEYALAIDRKYQYQDGSTAFANSVNQRLTDWGFNTLGAWAVDDLHETGMPYTDIVEFFHEGPFLPGTGGHRIPNIFDPVWLVNADKKARTICAPRKNSKDLIGYFTDNEIGFGNMADEFAQNPGFQSGQFSGSLLRTLLAADSIPSAYSAAWDFILKRYDQNFSALSAAWGVELRTKADLRQYNRDNRRFDTPRYAQDVEAFVAEFARRYFETAHRLIRRYDPNHLILGCRFGAPPPRYVLDAIKPWTDVISANNYQPILYERYDSVFQYTQLPILIGEFSWNTTLYKEVAAPYEPEMSLRDRMFARGKQTLGRMAQHEGIIGYTWYRWVQGFCTDTKFSDGLVDYADNPNMHVAELKVLNPRLSAIRRAAEMGQHPNQAMQEGEITLWGHNIRPGWQHYLRIKIAGGRAIRECYGYKMRGEILSQTVRPDHIKFNIRILFEPASGKNVTFASAEGVYEFVLHRPPGARCFDGTFTGTADRQKMAGAARAYYFDDLNLSQVAQPQIGDAGWTFDESRYDSRFPDMKEWAKAGVQGGIPARSATKIFRTLRPGDDLQAAIDAAHAAGGGVLLLERGEYPVTRTVVLRSGVILRGTSKEMTILRVNMKKGFFKTSADKTQLSAFEVNDAERVGFEDLTFRYAAVDFAPMDKDSFYGVWERKNFHEIETRDTNLYVHLLILRRCKNAWIDNCNFLRAGAHPLGIGQSEHITCRNNFIDQAYVKKDGHHGGYYACWGSKYCLFFNETVRRIRHFAIMNKGAAYNVVYGCNFEVDVNFHHEDDGHNLVQDCRIATPVWHSWGAIGIGANGQHQPPGKGNLLYRNDPISKGVEGYTRHIGRAKPNTLYEVTDRFDRPHVSELSTPPPQFGTLYAVKRGL